MVTEATEAERGRRAGAIWNDILRFGLREAGVAVALVLIVIFFSFAAPYFATPENFLKIFVQIGINTVLASGMTFVILTGGIDLSVGSVLALCTVVGALIMTNPALPFAVSIPLALLGCMGVGSLCGFVNGFVVEQWKVPSFIVTLGMLNVASGVARVVSDNATITGLPQPFIDFGNLIVFGVFPSIFLIAVAVILIGWFVLRFTVFGRFIYAIGTNEEAVRLSGHNPRTYKVAAFVISGLTAGVAAMVYLLRLNVGSPIAGVGYELNAIAAVIIGGTSLSGGKGSIIGTLVGACIIQVLSTGLQLFGVGDNVKPIVIGTVIVLAVVLDAYRDRYLRVIEFAVRRRVRPAAWPSEIGARRTGRNPHVAQRVAALARIRKTGHIGFPMLKTFSSDGVHIAYVDVAPEGTDRGEPILLIHGFASNHRINWVNPRWVQTLTRAGRRVVALDNRGHGAARNSMRRPTIART